MNRCYLTYGALIRELGLTPCHGILPTGHYCDFASAEHGAGRIEGRIIHFDDDPVPNGPVGDWRQMKEFLILCARALDPSLDVEDERWRKLYRTTMFARTVGNRVHVRVPRHFFTMDRLTVLAGVAGLTSEEPLRKQAFDWARR